MSSKRKTSLDFLDKRHSFLDKGVNKPSLRNNLSKLEKVERKDRIHTAKYPGIGYELFYHVMKVNELE
jgi:hypothetical protein